METMTKTINGFDQEAIGNTVSAIQTNPDIANFELRATNEWIYGAHNRSYVQGFYGACQEDTSRIEPFVYDNDEPPILLGNNKGANPGEVMLHGLLSCMTTAMVLLAAARGIEVSGISSKIEGDVDLKGFLGLDASVAKEFTQIRVTFDIKGASEAEKEELITLAKQSPVYNTLINPVDVQVSLSK
ncbi:MAG: OsmC family protein [Bacteroidota bacterium]